MLFNFLLKDEYSRLEALVQTREWNRLQIIQEQAELKTRVLQEIGSGRGLLFSFGAGCISGVVFEQREYLSLLKRIPISQLATLLSLLR